MPVTAAMQVWNHEVFAQPETLSKKFDYKEENSEKTVKEYPAKRILLATIEYEETELTNGLDYIKTKYTVLEENKISLPGNFRKLR